MKTADIVPTPQEQLAAVLAQFIDTLPPQERQDILGPLLALTDKELDTDDA